MGGEAQAKPKKSTQKNKQLENELNNYQSL